MKTGLASKILKGDASAAARLISEIEDETAVALEEMSRLYPHTGRAYIVGITGSPGAGKSTLTNNLIGFFREKKMMVGVVAVDPTSAFTGGAILGDRVRMQTHSADKDVFIRSLATRGWVGGLAKAALGAVHVMDGMGKEIILVETVGSGQIEIDITRAADTTVLVLTPIAGDEIQMMKAGILETADVFAINKVDKGGADLLRAHLELMLSMKPQLPGEWPPDIVLTEAIYGKGTEELAVEILRHREFLVNSDGLEQRQRERIKLELMETVEGYLKDFIHEIDQGDYLKKLVATLAQGKTNPQSAAREITARLGRDLSRLQSSDRASRKAS
ncbi:MAG: methylmalonyl Co-A mutase-associated GTPase MeaB [Dehalococcoidales bacterium]|nr:methylmalonyl Co-A mutase-associated GTPase MeaB [Dehalococcoidales bacterium]